MKFSVNTESMLNISNLASLIAQSINEGSGSINSITTHNDWNCKERDAINQGVIELKRCFANLNEHMLDFSKDIARSSAMVEELVANQKMAFGEADAEFASLYAIKTSESVSPMQKYNINMDGIALQTGLENYAAAAFKDTLKICHFDDIRFD